jgi:hypothetical protein
VKSIRPVSLALVMGAMLFALAGCGKSSDVTAPSGQTLDTTPPAAPTNVAGSYDLAAQRDYVNWTGSTSADVASYEVWQYDSDPAAGATGVLVGTTNAGTDVLVLPITSDARPAWFRVRAVDEAGNLSAYSSSAQHDLHSWSGTPTPGGGPIRDNGVN